MRGCEYAGAVTAVMCGEAYPSARIAGALGRYAGYAVNREPQLHVIDKLAAAMRTA
jgi:hypothetical protein